MGSDDKKKLDVFKISDRRRPEVRGSPGAKQGEGKEAVESPSAGFPAIEQRLEGGNVEAVAEELRASYEQLEAIADGKNKKDKAAAEKAMAAYERTADLFEYLFMTKEALSKPSGE